MSNKQFTPHLWALEDLFKHIYNVPVYQRPYSWDKEELITLLDDIKEAYLSEQKEEGFFTGNLIIYPIDAIKGLISKYDIIDGQQRITTLNIILLSIYALSIENGAILTDETLLNVKKALWKLDNRKHDKDLNAVNLNSIEKKCFKDISDQCFEKPEKFISFCKAYKVSSAFEERIINNTLEAYQFLKNNILGTDVGNLLDFADYILQYVQFIVIESTCQVNKVFSMFESINSKGKRLQEIDLIKTFIFSKLDERDYARYLDIWGQLIIRTRDNLYSYLLNYIKAYFYYYRQNINVNNFKAIARKELLIFFEEQVESCALKKLLDDMLDKVEYFNMLSNTEEAYKVVKSSKFRFYYRMFVGLFYQHPKALFFRTLVECAEGKIDKQTACTVVIEITKFMMNFLTICNRDSKDSITLFSKIMNAIYDKGTVDADIVVNNIAAEYLAKAITIDNVKAGLNNINAFEKDRRLSVPLLAFYESINESEKGETKISFDQADTIFSKFTEAFSLDHILVQSPDCLSENFKYYKDAETNKLYLKEGHDFPENIVVDGMDYDEFTCLILNKLGNVRIYYRDKNSQRQNTLANLKNYGVFDKYQNIKDRANNVIEAVVKYLLDLPAYNKDSLVTYNAAKDDSNLPSMKDLFEAKLINSGDKVYCTIKPNISEATVIDSKYLLYNNEKLTFNDWGCKITGWKSIRIYSYTAIVGGDETLQEKRLKYMDKAKNLEDIN